MTAGRRASSGTPSLASGAAAPSDDDSIQGRVWGGKDASERAERRRRQLLQAGYNILATRGWRDVTVERVCGEARLSKRYFYDTFANLDHLAGSVMQEIGDGVIAALDRATAEAKNKPRKEYVESLVSAIVENLTDDPRRAQLIFSPLVTATVLERHRTEVVTTMTTALARHGAAYHGASHGPLAEITGALLIGGLGQCIMQWLDGGIALSRDELAVEFATLALIVGDGYAQRARVLA